MEPEAQVTEQPTEQGNETAQPDFKSTKHRVKVEGKEVEVDYDELRNGYQLRQASQKRFEEAAKKYKDAEQFFDAIKKDPWGAAQQLGIDLDTLAEQRFADKLKYEMMDPTQRELLEKQKKIEEYEKKEADYKKNLEQRQVQELQAQSLQEIDKEIGDVLKQSGIKPSPKVVARIAEMMLASLERGERLPASKAYERTYADLGDEVTTFLGSLPPKDLLAKLPKETVTAIRQYFVGQVTDDKPFSTRREKTPSEVKSRGRVKSTDEYFKRLEAKFTT